MSVMKRLRTPQLGQVFERPVEILLVDFGGVLCHYEPTPQCDALVREHLGEASSLTRWLFDHAASWDGIAGRRSFDEVLSEIARRQNLSPAIMRRIWDAFLSANQVDLALVDALQQYRSRARIVVLSNYWSNGREVILGKLPEGSIDELIVSAEIGLTKSQREIWNHLSSHYGRPAGAFALLDDEEPNVRSAAAAGLDSYLWVQR